MSRDYVNMDDEELESILAGIESGEYDDLDADQESEELSEEQEADEGEDQDAADGTVDDDDELYEEETDFHGENDDDSETND
jgi:hypothetical protein